MMKPESGAVKKAKNERGSVALLREALKDCDAVLAGLRNGGARNAVVAVRRRIEERIAALQKKPTQPLSEAEAELLEGIKASDGAEIHRDDWPIAEALVARRGLIRLGPARGPNRDWRRAEVV